MVNGPCAAALMASIVLFGCSSTDATAPPATGGGVTNVDGQPANVGTAQLPPTGKFADIDMWLAKGDYKSWHCEAAPHDARSPSPHGKNRICSNDLSSSHTTGEYPVGAANVKELYDEAGAKIIGYAIESHVTTGAKGDSWYWYERNPLVGAPAKDGSAGLVANGLGLTAGTPERDVCVGCHAGAGSDAAHSGHDLVYTQVK